MIMRRARVVLLALAATLLAGCSFSFGSGPDYQKLEGMITEELNKSYAGIDQKVSSVNCPEQDPTPKNGDTFNCVANVDGTDVRVAVKVTSDEYDVSITTLDILFDLPDTANKLGPEMSKQLGFDVTVDCGEGLKAIETGKTFECQATDPNGVAKTVEVTAKEPGEGVTWKVLD